MLASAAHLGGCSKRCTMVPRYGLVRRAVVAVLLGSHVCRAFLPLASVPRSGVRASHQIVGLGIGADEGRLRTRRHREWLLATRAKAGDGDGKTATKKKSSTRRKKDEDGDGSAAEGGGAAPSKRTSTTTARTQAESEGGSQSAAKSTGSRAGSNSKKSASAAAAARNGVEDAEPANKGAKGKAASDVAPPTQTSTLKPPLPAPSERVAIAAAPRPGAAPSTVIPADPVTSQVGPPLADDVFYDDALVSGFKKREAYIGDKKYNPMGEAEDVVAAWSVGGVEIDLPDWRPQPNQEYRIVDPSVLDRLEKIDNMMGSQIKLVSTVDGIWRFLYSGNIRALQGCEAWIKMILNEDLGFTDVKQVRLETNYVRDWPDDWQ